MSTALKGIKLGSTQTHRLLALDSYVLGPLGISRKSVETLENLISLVNDVFGSSVVLAGNANSAVDAMWRHVKGMSRAARKKARAKNIHKVTYAMSGPMNNFRTTKVDRAKYYSPEGTADRKQRDLALLDAVKRPKAKKSSSPTVATKKDFYASWDWRTLRMEVIKEFGRACQCCGATPGMAYASGDPVRICVDHIKPISKFWELRLVKSNLQILCDECNQGKGNWDQTDFRPAAAPDAPDEWIVEDEGFDPLIVAQLSSGGRLQ